MIKSIVLMQTDLLPFIQKEYKQNMFKNTQKRKLKNTFCSSESKFINEPVQTVNGEILVKKYLRVKEVGKGAYSRCYLVRNVDSQSTYVAKIIPKQKLEVLSKEKLFYEIKIHQSLSHPNIVHLDHWFEDESNQYIFMEYCAKGNLQMKLEEKKNFSESMIKKYSRQIVQAISYLHSQKILHRDLKLCNFYLDENDCVKLGDFGFACQLANQNDKKRETCGTPNFIAPQAISGFGYSYSSDVWAIGVILFQLKFNYCPFEGENVKKTLENVKICNYKFPKGVKISGELKDLIEKIFNINYDQRLTTDEILNHPFFQGEGSEIMNNNKSLEKQKQGFSLKNIFSSQDKTKKKSVSQRDSRLKQKNQEPKRSNSCETFKQIKQIFKSKSKKTNTTTQLGIGRESNTTNTFHHGCLTTFNSITSMSLRGKEQSKKGSKNFIQMTAFQDFKHDEQGTRASKITEFVKSQVSTLNHKDQFKKKIQSKNNLIISNSKLPSYLNKICQRYLIPSQIQQQKDVLIIHYKPTLKQIIYGSSSFLCYRSNEKVYDMRGHEVSECSRLIKYIVQNKINLKQAQHYQNQEEFMLLEAMISSLAQEWIMTKEGILLKYGPKNEFTISKLFSQEGFFVMEDEKNNFMYQCIDQKFKILEGVVVLRIYSGWAKSLLKQ